MAASRCRPPGHLPPEDGSIGTERRPSPRRPSVRGVVAERPRGADSQTAVGVRPWRQARGESRRGKLWGAGPDKATARAVRVESVPGRKGKSQ